jgi:serine phosphatase RsbU (regulator of sigma subunit)
MIINKRMRSYFLFILLFFCKVFFSQNYKKAQLLKQAVLAAPQDTQIISQFISYLVKANDLSNDSMIAYWEVAHTFSKKANHELAQAKACVDLSNYYNGAGNYTKAINYLLEAEKIYESKASVKQLGKVYALLGNTYVGLNNAEQQLNYFTKCYNIGTQNKIVQYEAHGSGGLAGYYILTKNYKEAIKYFNISSELFKKSGNKINYSIMLSNIAGAYRELGDLKMAEEAIKKSEEDLINVNSNYASFCCYKEMGDIAMIRNQSEVAVSYYNKALQLMIEDKAIDNISQLYKNLADASYKAKKYKESSDYLSLHIQYKDSVFNETQNKQLVEVQEKYETDKKDSEIKLLNNQNELSKSEIDRKRVLIYGVIAVAVLLLVLLGLGIRSNIQKNKANAMLDKQKVIIEQKHKEITDSINYAERIQRSFLASTELLNENLASTLQQAQSSANRDYFIFFKPKDVVSGDFYWATSITTTTTKKFLLCTADSTGHGVPGAIMSLLNIMSLESAINDGFTDPSDILNTTRKRIIERLKKDGSVEGGKDGMDCSLISFDFENQKLNYSAANSSVWIIRENKLIDLPINKMPVGKHDKDKEPFTQNEFALQKGDLVYTLTDGYADQFGGPQGKKFMSKNLRELLISNAHLPMLEQKKNLETTFKNWLGNLEQVDDVTVVGIKI